MLIPHLANSVLLGGKKGLTREQRENKKHRFLEGDCVFCCCFFLMIRSKTTGVRYNERYRDKCIIMQLDFVNFG